MIAEQVQRIEEQEAFPVAEKYFLKTSGFDLTQTKFQKMMASASETRERWLDGVNLQYVLQFHEPDVFRDNALLIGESKLPCNFFYQIPKESVEGVYLYLITAGKALFAPNQDIMEFLYADIWGTSYVDAGTTILRERMEQDMKQRFAGKEVKLSKEFGPGYYGMDGKYMKPLFSLLDGERIDVRINSSGFLIPQKSCAGLCLVLNDLDFDEGPECASCWGREGCEFCQIWLNRNA